MSNWVLDMGAFTEGNASDGKKLNPLPSSVTQPPAGATSGDVYNLTSDSFETKQMSLLDELNRFPIYADDEAGNSVLTWIALENPYSYDDIKYTSMEAIMVCLLNDYMFAAGVDGSGGAIDTGFVPSNLRTYRDESINFKNLAVDVCRFLITGGNHTFRYEDSDVTPSLSETPKADEWCDAQWLTLGAEAPYRTLSAGNNTGRIKADGEIFNGLPGSDPEWQYRFDWAVAGSSIATVNRSKYHFTSYSAYKARTPPGPLRDRLAPFEGMYMFMPYSKSGLQGRGSRPSPAQWAGQLQEDNALLRKRTIAINATISAYLDNLRSDDPAVAAEAAEQATQLAEMQTLRNKQADPNNYDADGDGQLSATEQAAMDADAARLTSLEAAMGTDEDNQALAELLGAGAEFASEFRSKEQCFLLKHIAPLSMANISRQQQYTTDPGGPAAICVQGKPGQVVSALTYDPAYASYYLLTPDKLSYLVPSVKFYSVLHQYFEPDAQDPDVKTTVDLSTPVDFEVPFFQHITNKAISDIMNGGHGGKGGQVGMKSFDWSYQGSNPATSRRDIKASLTMHAQSFDDLLKPHQVALFDPNSNESFDHEWTYVDLAIRRNRDHMQAPDVTYQQLKVVVGWSLPDADTETLNWTSEEIRAVKNSRTTMYLTIIDHSFDIQDDGTVDFKIEFRAYIEGAFTSPEANILVNDEMIARNSDREAALAGMREDLSDPDGNCTEDDLAELRRRITNSIQVDKRDAHMSLIQGLERNRPGESRIFLYTVTAGEMVQFLRSPEISAVDWATGNAENSGTTPDLTGQEGIADQLMQDINFPSSIDFNDSENNPDVSEMMETVWSAPVAGVVKVPYFFLGDLVNVALENINKSDTNQSNITSTPRKFSNMRLLLGPVEISNPQDPRQKMQINLADIPISVNYFMEWFLEKIMAKQEAKWFIVDFIKDVTKNLVLRTLGEEDCFQGAHRQRSTFQNLYLVGGERGGTDPVSGLIATRANSPNSPTQQTKRLFVEEFMGDGDSIPILQQDTEDTLQPSASMYQYVLLYAADPTPRDLRGDWEEDTEKGVFHFHIGTNKGIVKRIRFEKTDQPYLREARYFGQGYAGISQLREPYKITIDMFGNSKVFPGQTIFVDPSGLGYGLGRPNQEGSQAHLLGLGGYHMIINVDHEITRGVFNTTAKATWVFRGSPAGEITDRDDPSTPTRASAECTAFGNLTNPSGYTPPADPPATPEGDA